MCSSVLMSDSADHRVLAHCLCKFTVTSVTAESRQLSLENMHKGNILLIKSGQSINVTACADLLTL